MKENLAGIIALAEKSLSAASTEAEIEVIRIETIGRKGSLTTLSKELGKLSKEERPAAGKSLNYAKQKLASLLQDANERVSGSSTQVSDSSLDVTLPGRKWALGKKHPVTKTIDDCIAIFRRLGFIVADGPLIDTVYNNFDALNAPEDHPSRDAKDTFYFPDGRLLRTQTSTVQIRVMSSQKPPIRIVAPGSCFRPDTPDATHSANFHQIEGLYVDENVSLADLKSTLTYFAHELLGEKVKIRFRPHFFPFTEPSVEYDFSCIMCEGKGCNVCKNSGWLEISGAGMVDPAVLRNVGYDPEKVSGFAWGMGVERIAMIRYRINDIRLLYENDVRFLNQF